MRIDSFEQFRNEHYFPALDGLRAISILLVLTAHSPVTPLHALNGYTGVTIFFVISGFLITTLLLREEQRSGRADLIGFYIRRVFRLLPLYLIALALFSLGVVLGLGENPGNYGQRLILFLTFSNEFATPGTFGHSWSLAVEEKFYIFWPLIAFAIPVVLRMRLWISVTLLVVASVVGLAFGDSGYVGIYSPIIAGCVLAVTAGSQTGYSVLRVAARAWVGIPILFATAALIWISTNQHTQVLVGLAVAAAFPGLLMRSGWARRLLSLQPIVWAGRRAYAVYLFHPLVGSAVAVVLPTDGLLLQIIYLIAITVGSFLVAEVLYRYVEKPLIEVGRRLSARPRAIRPPEDVGPAPIGEP